jgi:hypothetical protein
MGRLEVGRASHGPAREVVEHIHEAGGDVMTKTKERKQLYKHYLKMIIQIGWLIAESGHEDADEMLAWFDARMETTRNTLMPLTPWSRPASQQGKGFLCLDCEVDTFEIDELYVVTDELWARVNPGKGGMLCIGCLEKRLGRELTPDDFPSLPLNSDHHGSPKSERLLERRGGINLSAAAAECP